MQPFSKQKKHFLRQNAHQFKKNATFAGLFFENKPS
jgi:hypothetical protein